MSSTRSVAPFGWNPDQIPAYDDQTSTFVIPAGGGFEVVFCPPGRSTNILTTNKAALVKLGQQLGERMVMYSEEMGRALEATNGEPRREENVGKEKVERDWPGTGLN